MMVVCNGVVFESREAAKKHFGATTYGAGLALYMEDYCEAKHLSLLRRQTKALKPVRAMASKAKIPKQTDDSAQWLKVRAEILAADDYVCRICHATEDLHVHHIDKSRKNNRHSNLVTLCASCHRGVHATNYIAGADEYDGGTVWQCLSYRD